MSKYIRTKDRLCELTGAFAFCNGNKHDILNNIKLFEIVQSPHYMRSDEIINEADTIKELCDGFVLKGIGVIFINKDNTQYRFGGESVWHDITAAQIIKIGVYGAIWTEKGLIYVAKMNEKGELVLL